MGSAISIVIAVVAVVVGFVILRNINDSGDGGGSSLPVVTSPNDGTSDTTATSGAGATDTTLPPTTTPGTVPLVKTSKIIVANASQMKGAAANAKQELETIGFVVGDPTDAQGADRVLETTKVYYAEGGQETAQSVAQVFSKSGEEPIKIYPLIPPVNVAGGSIGDAQVLLMVGKDRALQPLPAIAAATPDPTATTIPATTTTVSG
jgi:hypothetical protein